MKHTKFACLVKKGVENENISLRELARRSGLDVSFLSKILSGTRNPPAKEKDIKKIAEALNLNPRRLIIAAGRIPASLMDVFEDDKFVDSLVKGNFKDYIPPEKSLKKGVKKEKNIVKRHGYIEDELL